MNHIYKLIETIAATTGKDSKKTKIALLEQNDSAELRFVCDAAYNPRKCYNLSSKVKDVVGVGVEEIDMHEAADILDRLQSRRLSGNEAVSTITAYMQGLTPECAELFKRILNKDLRAGFSDSTINKAFKNLIPEYPYQRCNLLTKVKTDKWPWKRGIYSQQKMDGMYGNFNYHTDGDVMLLSRNGSEMPVSKFQNIVDFIVERAQPGYQLHGELLVREDGKILPREEGNGILTSVQKGGSFGIGQEPVFVCWDIIPIEYVVPKGKYNVPYSQRFKQIEELVGDDPDAMVLVVPTRIVYSLEEAIEHYVEMLRSGFEGTVIKNCDAFWMDGTSKDQLKLKLEVVVDLEIEGFNPGEGKNAAMFGSVRCKTCDGILTVNVSGFSDELRMHIHLNRDSLVGQIMAVKSNLLMKSKTDDTYSLFLPRHVEIRTDKTKADSIQDVIDQFELAIYGKLLRDSI